MLQVISSIGEGIFVPFWFFLAASCLVALYQLRHTKRYKKLIIFVLAIPVYMLLWRIIARIGSARYAIALIIPAVLFSAAFFRNSAIPGLIRITLGIIFLVFLIAKDLRFNHYGDFREQTVNIIRQDLSKFSRPSVWSFCKDESRFAYYGHLSRVISRPFNLERAGMIGYLRRSLPNSRADHDVIYILCTENSGTPPLLAEELGVAPEHWTLLSRRFRDNRQRKYLSLYRAISPAEEFHPDHAAPELPGWLKQTEAYLLPNGEFELAATEREWKGVEALFKSKGSGFCPESRLQWPSQWIPHNGYGKDSKAVALLTGEALSGRRSLFMQSETRISSISTVVSTEASSILGFILKGEVGSQFDVELHYFSEKGVLIQRDITSFELDSSHLRIYRIPVADFPENKFKTVRMDFYLVRGKIWLDHCCLYPAIHF